ncbi:MAG: 2-C-methyl-D-erythritol 4-phosphate cytidylyltransferase, partial [Sphingopyxis sp.]|nr:2-C-methyl-D-erythritol 4-phosphate cytidylyltransferase [Sphingopyxis sp.]
MFSAIIVAGGHGTRSGLDHPKQFAPLNGRSLLWWSSQAFAGHPELSRLVVVIPAGLEADAEQALDGLTAMLVPGGATRQQSVRNGLEAINDDDAPLIFVHDAARPGVGHDVIDRLLMGLRADDNADGAIPVLPVADTLVLRGDRSGVVGPVVDRNAMLRVQTPQLFRREALDRAHGAASDSAATDDAQMVRAMGGDILAIDGDARLDKVTLPGDLTRMAAVLSGNNGASAVMRPAVGMGYDVHRLIA